MKKSWFKLSNITNGLFIVALVVLIFNPSAKAFMIEGLMKVGLFQPDLNAPAPKANIATMPDVALQSTDGKTLHLADLKGKVVFINFWATWCPPCIAEMPSINTLYEKLKDNPNIVFVMVDADHNFSKSVPFMRKHKFGMPLYQLAGPVPESLVSNSIPTTTIIDKAGRTTFHHEGGADYSNPKIFTYLTGLAK
jgi:thiol-disulfide isomerase/thioredoxin